jgi:cytochrome c oxidase subunit 2
VRRREFALAASAWLAGAGGSAIAQEPAGGERRIHVGAARFAFSVAEIGARKGETLVIALTATDFVHGFSLPDLKARIDVPPGKGVELTLRSLPAGRFIYLCDNFCGENHDRMTGVLTVV